MEVEVIFKNCVEAKLVHDTLKLVDENLGSSPNFEHQLDAFASLGVNASDVFNEKINACKILNLTMIDKKTVRFILIGGVSTGADAWQNLFELLISMDIELLISAELDDRAMAWCIRCSNGEKIVEYATGAGGEIDGLIFSSMDEEDTLDVVKKLFLDGEFTKGGINRQAVDSVRALMYKNAEDTSQDEYDKAIFATIKAIKNGFSDIIHYYEAMKTVPGREFEWAAIQCFPEVITPDCSHIVKLEKDIGRSITKEEFQQIHALSEDLTTSFNKKIASYD
ncbi:MAG TPA: hypothetical protein VGD52_04085 [Pseudoduganella sp.]